MERVTWARLGMAASAAALIATGAAAKAPAGVQRRPRLVLMISIDQFRADYVTRFDDLFLPPRSRDGVGGFLYLRSRGAWYPDCRYDHHRSVTAPGHAILGTGAQPSVNGIVGNSWWDRAAQKVMYCVGDSETQVVGAQAGSTEKPMSAVNLLTTTVVDELEAATGGASRTASISIKDRAAILMAGHRVDAAAWFDEITSGWVTSRYYSRELPRWAAAINAAGTARELRAGFWTPSLPGDDLLRAASRPEGERRTGFRHPRTGSDFTNMTASPAGNDLLFATARGAVTAESLGQDEIPDVLCLNLASNDIGGHRYGPDSSEVLDLTVDTDRRLAGFLRFLDRAVPGGLKNVTVALSSDHGVARVPEQQRADRIPAARLVASSVLQAADRALDAAIGAETWFASGENGELYFAPVALARHPGESLARLEQIAVDAAQSIRGVAFSIGKSAVLAGRVPRTRLGEQISRGIHPQRSGDVIVFLEPHWLPGSTPVGTGTSHGTPYPYDTHVPLLAAGMGFRQGVYLEPVSPARLAPSLSAILGIARPSGADEPLLPGLNPMGGGR